MHLNGLIVGLGNPGKEYEQTRHNLGFMLVDTLLEDIHKTDPLAVNALSSGKKKYEAWKYTSSTPAGTWLMAKPLAYMNKSGDAVAHLCGYYRIPVTHILVLHDELDLPLGKLKFKTGGGLAGHNGLRSIVDRMGSNDFHRMRLGIGKPNPALTTGHVLSAFNKTEYSAVKRMLQVGVDGIHIFMEQGPQSATQFVNSQSLL